MGDDGLDPEQRLQRMARQLHEAIDEPPRRDGGGQPMTKEQVREIIEAIKAIPIVDVTETNRLLVQIRAHLDTIKWGVVILTVLITIKLLHG